jgi:hypothetical protein
MTLAAIATGLVLSALGWGVERLWPGAVLPLAVGLGVVALVYSLHELGFVQLPVPGREWQVPASWVRHGFYRSAAVFGSVVGFGVFTRVPYASLPVLLAWLFVTGNPVYGAIAGAVYGALRAFSIYSSASTQDAEGLVGLNQRLMRYASALHRPTGVALATFATYLLVAPFI